MNIISCFNGVIIYLEHNVKAVFHLCTINSIRIFFLNMSDARGIA